MLLSLLIAACTSGTDEDSQGPADSETDVTETGGTETSSPHTGGEDSEAPVSDDPDLVVISIDTLRRDAVGRHGGYDTPNLDALLASGLSFDNHRSCSNWTFPSMLCGLTGSGLLELEFVPVATPTESPVPVPDGITMLGDFARARGYRSAAVNTSPFLTDEFNGQRWDSSIYNIDFTGEQLAAAAMAQAELLMAEPGPWALHAHFMDPHSPFDPPDGYLDLSGTDAVPWNLATEVGLEAMRADWDTLSDDEQQNALEIIDRRYEGDVRYFDDQLGVFLADLEALGALDDAVILVFSDHGEQFMEHGGVTHGQDLYDEEAGAIAALVGAPFGASSSTAPTTHADLLPTLFTGLSWDLPASFTGSDVALIDEDRSRTAIHLFSNGTEQTLDLGSLRLLYRWSGELELYDLSSDPQEQNDLAAEPEWLEQRNTMWERLAPQVQALAELYTTVTPIWPDLSQ